MKSPPGPAACGIVRYNRHGIDDAGRRSVLGVSVSLSEARSIGGSFEEPAGPRPAWAGIDCQRRPRGAEGSAASLPWQRALATLPVHLLHNALAHVPKEELKRESSLTCKACSMRPICPPPRSDCSELFAIRGRRRRNLPPGSKPMCLRASPCCVCRRVIARRLRTTNMLERLKPRAETPHPRRHALPQRSLAPATSHRRPRRSQRGMGNRQTVTLPFNNDSWRPTRQPRNQLFTDTEERYLDRITDIKQMNKRQQR